MIEQIFTCIREAAKSAGSNSADFYIEIFVWIPKDGVLEIDGIPKLILGLTKEKLEDCLELLAIFRPSVSNYQRVGSSLIFKIKMKNPERKQIGFLITQTG